MTVTVTAAALTLGLGGAVWAQQPGPPAGPMGPGLGMGGSGMTGWAGVGHGQPWMHGPGMMGGYGYWGRGRWEGPAGSRFDRPLLSILLRHRDAFRLTPEQEQKIRALRADYEKAAARGEADIRVAEVDLREALVPDPPDLGKVEALTKAIATRRGDLRFRRIQALQSGLALLTKEQRQQLESHLREGYARGRLGMMGGPGEPRPPAPPSGGADSGRAR